MGRKPGADDKKVEEKKADEELKVVDPPAVVDMKALDDKYLAIEKELEQAITKLRREYKVKLDPLLGERRKILDAPSNAADDSEASLATPACKGFWFTAMKRLPSTTQEIEVHDAEVLEYLSDVRADDLDSQDETKGFKVEFEFVENPYFTNTVLAVEFHGKENNPYSKEMTCTEIKSAEIDWKAGKNVTVEKVAKKVKGGGAKKKKGKEKEEARDSFFRSTFRNLKLGDDIPDDLNMEEMMDQIDDEDEFVGQYLDNQMEIFRMVKDNLVPHAVRVFTGEAFPEEDDDDEESEEEDDEDDSEEDESETPSPAAKKKPAKKAVAGGGQPKAKDEECKQQ